MRAHKGIQTIVFFYILAILFLYSGCTTEEKAGEVLHVQYFYLNLCASCDESEDFLQDFETRTGISRSSPNVDIQTYNTYNQADRKKYEEIMLEKNVKERSLPVMIVNDEVVFASEIETFLASETFLLSIPDFELIMPHNASKVIFFSQTGCRECEQVEEIINDLPESVILPDGESSIVRVIKISIGNDDGASLFRTYCIAYNVADEYQTVPIVFIGEDSLSGKTEIERAGALLSDGEGLNTPVFQKFDVVEAENLNDYRWFGFFTSAAIFCGICFTAIYFVYSQKQRKNSNGC